MKNCEPLESGPEFAIETTPAFMGVSFQRNNSNTYLKNDKRTSSYKKENDTNEMKCSNPSKLLHTCMRMLNPEILIREGATINRFRCFAIMMNNISTLNHETRYYPMKWCSFVIKFYATFALAFLPYTIWNTPNQCINQIGVKFIKTMKRLQLPVHKALKFSAYRKIAAIRNCNFIRIVKHYCM